MVDIHEGLQDFLSVVLENDGSLSDLVCVVEFLAEAARFNDGSFDDVQSAGLDGDADGVVVGFVGETAFECSVDHVLKAFVDGGGVLAEVVTLLDVEVDALVYNGLHEESAFVEVEEVAGVQCEFDGLVVLL